MWANSLFPHEGSGTQETRLGVCNPRVTYVGGIVEYSKKRGDGKRNLCTMNGGQINHFNFLKKVWYMNGNHIISSVGVSWGKKLKPKGQ